MALAAVYQQFLAAPDPSHLIENATLYYITTTTTFRGASDIIQHLNTLQRQIKKKKENVISLVQGQDAIATEIETGLEFVTSGASYLPGLDDNFLADRTVYLPIMHMVNFDNNGKIMSIRQSWDQGALLKQLDIIGKSGRNWPIHDSKDQIKMIENCVKSAIRTNSATSQPSTTVPDRSRGNLANALRDPHASLSLFESREGREESLASVISPRGGVRPRQRDFSEILGDEPDDVPASPSAGRHRSVSPSKAIAPRGGTRPPQRGFNEILGGEPVSGPGSSETVRDRSNAPSNAIAPKAGGGKNFQPSRLFEVDEIDDQGNSPEDVKSPDRLYRPHPKKYSHFEFDDGSESQDAPQPGEPTTRNPKHNSQWSFDDFVTPAKFKPGKTLRHQEAHQSEDDVTSQIPVQGKARRDAEKHFEFADDGSSPAGRRPMRPRGSKHNNGLGLYENNLYDEEGKTPTSTEGQQPLGTITNLKDRGRDFDAHWSNNATPNKSDAKATVSDDRMKAVKMMESNWSAGDESPAQKENQRAASKNGPKTSDARGIAIGGDGMGSNKGSSRDIVLGGDSIGSNKGSSRGIVIAGDGMGGNKGSSRNWFFSDEDDTHTTKPVPGRKPPAAKSGGFNWDF